MEDDHYELLGIECSASSEDIRKAFKDRVLKCHPDKCDSEKTSELFNKIIKSYEILSDEVKRTEYDAIRKEKQLSEKCHVNEEVTLSSMTGNGNSYSLGCRCGGEYVIAEVDFIEDCLIECDTCSLCIKLNKK